jgi:type IV conjugative transfer system protein TraL
MENNGNLYYIARGLDDPIPIFFFDPVDFVLLVAFFGLGIVTKQFLIGAFLAWAVLKLSKVMKRGAKRGAVMHSLWRVGLLQDKSFAKFNPLKSDYTA